MLSTYERVIRNHHAHKSESGILRLAIYYMYGSTYKEWGSLCSATPCLCMDFICVSTAWKVTACMVLT